MATVRTLVDFYNNQNRLAVEAAGQTASLEAAKQRQDSSIASQERMQARQQRQLEQLEQFRQQMDNLRQARSLSSEERTQAAQLLADQVQGEFAQASKAQESERDRAFKAQLEQFKQAGANERTEFQQEAADRRAKLNADVRLTTAAGTPAEQRLKSAQAIQAEKKARLLGQVPKEDLIANLQSLKAARDSNAIDKRLYQSQKKLIEEQLQRSGIDTQNDPDVLDALLPSKEERQEQFDELNKSLSETIKTSAVSKLQSEIDRQYQLLQSLELGEGVRWASPEARNKGVGVIHGRIKMLEEKLQRVVDAV